ncbi:Proline-rich receptor-like protein kinase PERK14 [Hibiscus syriacus]|uniref:non-specific serine/threonine protein kinase n=1 Tax=Hibiscus syriacus TaxID=106335 RepID=A0A6A2ZRU2_HIBSY|nr:Proline-rich receptor-like protein kinase PERK14 [Hibiscus syriacus]
MLSPSLSPSPLDSPSSVSPPLPVVQQPLPPPPVSASPPPLLAPHLAPISTPPLISPPVLPALIFPPPAAVAASPVTLTPPLLPTPPVVVVVAYPPPISPAATTISPIVASPATPLLPPPPALVIPPPLLPKSSSPPPQQSKPLPSTPPSVILPPPATRAPSLPPPRLPIDPPLLASISPPPPAASHSIRAPKTPAFPPPAPPPPLTPPAVKGGLSTTKQTPHSPIGLIVVCIGAGILLFIVLAFVCICCKGRRRRRKQNPLDQKQQSSVTKASIQHKQEKVDPPLLTIAIGSGSNIADTNGSRGIFTYDELLIATDGFSKSNLLGQGDFGYVYKGRLLTGQDVAVKKLNAGSRQGEREFQAEVETISRVHHKHLVSLVGYCINGAERLFVYEFVPNKTLEFHLHENGQSVILWERRLKIAIGSAKGIAYLHEDCSPTIIHRDIKAANVLLDPRFEAKVSDFGLAKIFFDASPSVTPSLPEYLAPEYALTGKLTDKSDVYSYGVMLLELITGRRPIIELESSVNHSLVDWARPLLARALENNDFDTLVDPRSNGAYNISEMATMFSCAAACVRQSAWLRPRMIQVVRALEDDISLTTLSNSSLNTSSEMFIQNARRCINNGGFSGHSESTSEYGLNINPSGSSTESQRPKSRDNF